MRRSCSSNGLSRVEQQDDHLGEAHGIERIRDRELLDLLLDPAATAQAGSVVHAELPVPPVYVDGDGVAGDTGLWSGQHPFLADQPVHQGRFSGIWTSDHRDADRVLPDSIPAGGTVVGRSAPLNEGRSRGRLWQCRAKRRVEIGEPLAVLGGDGNRLAEAELIGFEHAGLRRSALALVCDQDRGLARPAHEIGKIAVRRRCPRSNIDQEQHRVGSCDGGRGLLLHATRQALRRSLLETCRVDHREGEIAQPRAALPPIAGHPRAVIHQCRALADQAVEQRRLADIRPSDDGDRELHEGDRASIPVLCRRRKVCAMRDQRGAGGSGHATPPPDEAEPDQPPAAGWRCIGGGSRDCGCDWDCGGRTVTDVAAGSSSFGWATIFGFGFGLGFALASTGWRRARAQGADTLSPALAELPAERLAFPQETPPGARPAASSWY